MCIAGMIDDADQLRQMAEKHRELNVKPECKMCRPEIPCWFHIPYVPRGEGK